MNHDRLSPLGLTGWLSSPIAITLLSLLCCGIGGLPTAHGQAQSKPIARFLLLEPEQVFLAGDEAVESHASGSFGCRWNASESKLEVKGSFRGLSSDLKVLGDTDSEGNPAGAVHLHIGGVGAAGPIRRNMTVAKDGDRFTFDGSFHLNEKLKACLLSERTYVQIHTETNPKGELRGQIFAVSLAAPRAVDETKLTEKERKALQQAREATEKPLIAFPADLFESYQVASKYPVLSLTPSRSGDDTIDLPFPPLPALKSHPEYRDRRDADDLVDDQRKRFLRKYRSLNVDKDDWVTQKDASGNTVRSDRQSYSDHPGVQPRPARPLHYRFGLEDPLQQWDPETDPPLSDALMKTMKIKRGAGAQAAALSESVAPPSRSIRSQTHPRDLYMDDMTSEDMEDDASADTEREPTLEAITEDAENASLEEVQPADSPTKSDSSTEKTNVYDPRRLFSTLPRFGKGGSGKTMFTIIDSPRGIFPKMNPFKHPPGTNMLPTAYQNMRDRMNNEMVNTLPSTPDHPYNLHEGDPVVSRLPTHASPTDDLRFILDDMFELLTGRPVRSLWEGLDRVRLQEIFEETEDGHRSAIDKHRVQLLHRAEWAIDIIEGNAGSVRHGRDGDGEIRMRSSRIPSNRAYRGFALLHHSGHRRAQRVRPIYDEQGRIVAGNVDVHQIWYDGRIESDTMYYDFGWDDIPLRIRNENDEIEVRWYSSTDPKLTVAHWNEYRRQKSALQSQPTKDVFCQTHRVAGLTPNPPPLPRDTPWTVSFTVDILNRGEDDFSPAAFYFDYPQKVRQQPGPFSYSNLSYHNDSEDPDPTYSREAAWGKMNFNGTNQPMRFGPPHVGMDGTFFPLAEGTRTHLRLKMAPTQYQNVHYTWGWRKHAPRAQAVENMHKRVPPRGDEFIKQYGAMRFDQSFVDSIKAAPSPQLPKPPPRFFRLRIDDHERMVFDGIDYKLNPQHPHRHVGLWVERYLEEEMVNQPRRRYLDGDGNVIETESEAEHQRRVRTSLRQQFTQLAKAPFAHPPQSSLDDDDYDPRVGPMLKLGDFAPAKRLWRAFHGMEEALQVQNSDFVDCLYDVIDARDAYLDWKDRNHLPSGLKPDPDSDMTILFVNNTIYGEMREGGLRFEKWLERDQQETDGKPAQLRLTVWNGDYFVHGYANPDFGGLRGWENQFKSTLPLGGQGSLFTFGRNHWRFNAMGGTVGIPPAVKQILVDGKLEDLVEKGTQPTGLSVMGEPKYDSEQPDYVRLGVHKCWFRFNYEPSIRLRFYQFDPLHHDVAIYSVH